MLKALQNSLLSVIYPQQCRICSRQVIGLDGGVACASCWASSHTFDGSEMLCDRCGALLGKTASSSPVFCRRCDSHDYDKAAAVGVYDVAMAAVVLELKRVPHIPRHLIGLIQARFVGSEMSLSDLIMPVPLSRQRTHERGFNQAEVIADQLARFTGNDIDRASLIRRVHTPTHRIGMDQRARELTVVNAFNVVRPKLVKGKTIVLVDDIFTSGATASACAKVLKKNGAGRVNVFTLARAIMH
ncbi:MAG: ComF family protein [Pyrinomonadaceae bacterium]